MQAHTAVFSALALLACLYVNDAATRQVTATGQTLLDVPENATEIATERITVPEPPTVPADVHFVREPGGGVVVSDVSGLNLVRMSGVVFVHSVGDVQAVLRRAAAEGLKVSVRGCGHTSGGHTMVEGGVQIDMRHMNRVLALNPAERTIVVEAGAHWSEVIRRANLYGLSPTTLQSYSSFSIGGSISVNAHGITNDLTLGRSIISLLVVTADGAVRNCSLTENRELFRLVVGGYGLFGVIVAAELRLVENERYTLRSEWWNLEDFTRFYRWFILGYEHALIGVKIARLQLVPDLSSEGGGVVHVMLFYRAVAKPVCAVNGRDAEGDNYGTFMNRAKMAARFHALINCPTPKTMSKRVVSVLRDEASEMSDGARLAYKWLFPLTWAQSLRYWLERHSGLPMDWHFNGLQAERNELLHESAHSLAVLDSSLVDLQQTHILQEFFVPPARLRRWIRGFQDIRRSYSNTTAPVLLNLTIRFVRRDPIAFLAYAPRDMFAMVLYFRVARSDDDPQVRALGQLHQELVRLTLSLNGTFYLPYRHENEYTRADALTSFPNLPAFLALRRQYDPHRLFDNRFAQWLDPAHQSTPSNATQILQTDEHTMTEVAALERGDVAVHFRELAAMPTHCLALKDLELFYRYIFVLVPEEGGAAVRERVGWFNSAGHKLAGAELYAHLQAYANERIASPLNLYGLYRQYIALKQQKRTIVDQTVRLLSMLGNEPMTGYLSIGDGGRYEAQLRAARVIRGPRWILHDREPLGWLERNVGLTWSQVWPWLFDFDDSVLCQEAKCTNVDNPLLAVNYSDVNSIQSALSNIGGGCVRLVTCYIGFHHFTTDVLSALLVQLGRIVAPGGYLVLREHNATPDLVPLLHVAHSTFNAFTGVSYDDEMREHRDFRTLNHWRSMLHRHGFVDTWMSERQPFDPTHNVLIAFRRTN